MWYLFTGLGSFENDRRKISLDKEDGFGYRRVG